MVTNWRIVGKPHAFLGNAEQRGIHLRIAILIMRRLHRITTGGHLRQCDDGHPSMGRGIGRIGAVFQEFALNAKINMDLAIAVPHVGNGNLQRAIVCCGGGRSREENRKRGPNTAPKASPLQYRRCCG